MPATSRAGSAGASGLARFAPGRARRRRLQGLNGADTLIGGLGNDTLAGGDGTRDTLSFSGAAAGVNVSLATGTAIGTTSGRDTVSGIEQVIGGSFADTITGGVTTDTLIGGAGADSLSGGDGNDLLHSGGRRGHAARRQRARCLRLGFRRG